MSPLDLVKLTALIERFSGRPEMMVGLIDGPVAMNHSDLATENIREIPGRLRGACAQANSAACLHGTFLHTLKQHQTNTNNTKMGIPVTAASPGASRLACSVSSGKKSQVKNRRSHSN